MNAARFLSAKACAKRRPPGRGPGSDRESRMTRIAQIAAALLWRLHRLADRAFAAAVTWLAVRGRPGAMDLAAYRTQRRPGSLGRRFPRLHFAIGGARAGLDPLTGLPSAAGPPGAAYPAAVLALLRPAPEALAAPAAEENPPAQVADEQEAPAEPAEIPEHWYTHERRLLNAAWPAIERELSGIPNLPAQLVPDEHLHYRLKQSAFDAAPNLSPNVSARIAAAVPAGVKHMVAVPWLGLTGGSERITALLMPALRELYGPDELSLVVLDGKFPESPTASDAFGVPVVALDDWDVSLTESDRIEIFARLLIERSPETVHSMYSGIAWLAFAEEGARLAQHSRLFGHIYSDVLYDERLRLGIFWEHLPRAIPHMHGVIADNARICRRAKEVFGLPSAMDGRFHVLRTPIVGIPGEDAPLRAYDPDAGHGCLWMSRVAREKRLDVLAAVARRMPQRPFAMYGTILKIALPPDLSWLEETPNVDFRGRYGELSDLPLHEFSSYIFTTSAEGMPIALLESAMLGLPAVAPDVGGIGEFVDGTTGWLVSRPDDVDGYVAAIEAADADRAEAGRRVAAAQRRLQQEYSWDAFQRTIRSIPGYLAQ